MRSNSSGRRTFRGIVRANRDFCKCSRFIFFGSTISLSEGQLIGDGASGLLVWRPKSPEYVACSWATPDLRRCNLGVALEQGIASELLGRHTKRSLALPLGNPGIWALYQANNLASKVVSDWSEPPNPHPPSSTSLRSLSIPRVFLWRPHSSIWSSKARP